MYLSEHIAQLQTHFFRKPPEIIYYYEKPLLKKLQNWDTKHQFGSSKHLHIFPIETRAV